ncbi:hypothetical protein N0V90_013392 [Kalmusia sp. IMI 367209]|nr:hypothetical protein N0V90_013392 [Kalmusia sp. IMI 367209]
MQLWEEAVDECLNKSKRGSVVQEWKTPIATQADLEGLIEQHQFDFSRFRSSREEFWGVLMSTFRQLQMLKVAQAGLALTLFAPASVILKCSIFLISSGEAVTDTYDALETLFKRIKDITNSSDEDLKGSIDENSRQVIIQLLGYYEDAIAAAAKALDIIPDDRYYTKIPLLRLIQEENLQLGEQEAAFKASSKAWDTLSIPTEWLQRTPRSLSYTTDSIEMTKMRLHCGKTSYNTIRITHLLSMPPYALASLYFTKADEYLDPVETQLWISKLELVDLVEPMIVSCGVFATKDEASMLLGKWYAEHNQTDLARAKIRPMNKRNIRELTDKDDGND